MGWQLSAFADEAGPTCAEQVAALRRAGIRRIDLRSVDGENISALPLDHARRVRQQLDEAGIATGMFGSPIGKIDVADDFAVDEAKLRHLAALAPIFGCRAVRIFSYYNRKAGWPRTDFRAEALRRLRALKALAGELGLVLYHENESDIFGDRADDVLAVATELRDGGTFRTIFDFGNYHAGRENVWDNWVKLRDLTDAIHLKDNRWVAGPGGAETLQHTPAGDGGGFVAEILADAVRRRFAGPVVVEAHLAHSAAVRATGPAGVPSQKYADLPPAESFQIACAAARDVLVAAGAVLT
jgi:sugar phosphate isomerase/epimerase